MAGACGRAKFHPYPLQGRGRKGKNQMIKIEMTEEQSEIVYLALSKAQNALPYEATDEEYEALEVLMNLVIGRAN